MNYESTETRRVLFVSYSFPPSMEMGAYTCSQIARYLPLYGWEPVVLTVKERHIDDPYVEDNEADRASDSDLVIRTYKFPHPTDIYRRFKSRGLVKLSLNDDWNAAPPANGENGKPGRRARDLLLSLSSVPDKFNGWLIPAVSAGLRAVKETKARVIFSSAPYFTCHLAGYWLARLTGLPWMAHFRAPWITGAPPALLSDDFRLKLNRALERMAISRADAVVCVTEEHAALLRAAYDHMPPSKFAVVMNGFDGLEWEEVIESLPTNQSSQEWDRLQSVRPDSRHGQAEVCPATARKFRITYAGNLYMKRNPEPLFRALRTLIDCGEIGRDEVSVELIGLCESSEGRGMADIVSEAGIEGCVEMRGRLCHSETLRSLLQSDLLLLLAEEMVIQIPGKTYEYLKTGRPILALTPEGAVANLLRRTGGAWVVRPDDQPGIVNAVRERYLLWKRGLPGPAPDPMIIESFDRRRTTGRIADLLGFLAK